MPSLARAAKVVSRLDRAGLGDRVDAQVNAGGPGAELLGIVARLVRDGDDPDAALRAAVRAPVSYTHLEVYKRQREGSRRAVRRVQPLENLRPRSAGDPRIEEIVQ